jgi:hypothetical protein
MGRMMIIINDILSPFVGKEMKTLLHLISKSKRNQFIKTLQNFNYKHTADSENVQRYRKKERKSYQLGLGSFASSEAKTLWPQ